MLNEKEVSNILLEDLKVIKDEFIGKKYKSKSEAEEAIIKRITDILDAEFQYPNIESQVFKQNGPSIIRIITNVMYLDGKAVNHGTNIKSVLGFFIGYSDPKYTIEKITIREPFIKFEDVEDVTMVQDSKYPHLDALIKELNAKNGEFDSLFDFEYRIEDGLIYIYDKNEVYGYDFADEEYALMKDVAEEFGFEPPKKVEDRYKARFEEALKADKLIDEDGFLDWENSVVMVTAINNPIKDSNKYMFDVYLNDKLIGSFNHKDEAMKKCSETDGSIIKYEKCCRCKDSSELDLLDAAYKEYVKCIEKSEEGKVEYSEKLWELLNKIAEITGTLEEEILKGFEENYKVESIIKEGE